MGITIELTPIEARINKPEDRTIEIIQIEVQSKKKMTLTTTTTTTEQI